MSDPLPDTDTMQAMDTALARLGTTHPRLLARAEDFRTLRSRLERDALLKKIAERVITWAERCASLPCLQREQEGRRLLAVSREALRRLTHLAMAWHLTGDRRHLERASLELRQVCAFADWNPSHFLDVAEMCVAVAVGYDWLHAELDDETKAICRQALRDKGLRPALAGGWWVDIDNNWNAVCHSGTMMAALTIHEHEPDLARDIIHRAVAKLPIGLRVYGPDGAYPEGPMYWNYGTSFAVLGIASLQTALGDDFGLLAIPGFAASATYYRNVIGPTGLFANYCDCHARGKTSEAMFWFAERLERPDLLWHEHRLLGESDSDETPSRLLPLLLLWAGPLDEIPSPTDLHWQAGGVNPVAVHRSGWAAEDAFLCIKGGSPGSIHAHMDSGAFIYEVDGQRWAIDLGGQDYHGLESAGLSIWDRDQQSDRWRVFRYQTSAHNTLMVDGHQQRVDGLACIAAFSAEPGRAHSRIDLGPVYQGQLASAERGGTLLNDGSALIQDEVRTLDRPTRLRWAMTTRAAVRLGERGALLEQNGKKLRLQVLDPDTAELDIVDISRPAATHDADNPDTRQLVVTLDLAANSEATLSILLQRGGERGVVEVRALRDW